MERRNLIQASLAVAGTAAAAALVGAGPAAAEPTRPTRRGTLRVQFVVYEGVEELHLFAPVEVLGLARALGADLTTTMVGVDGREEVTAAFGTVFGPVAPWAPREADILVVPGGGYRRADAPGVRREIERGVLPAELAAARRPGLTFMGICTGVMLLSAAGLVQGRSCTTHHRAVEDLRAQGGLIREARVVDDGDLVTAGGVTSGLDVTLYLIERWFGADLATRLERILEYERRGTVWRA